MDHGTKAEALFKEGYNCAQAVLGAYAEELGLPIETAMKLSSSFGGGMGRIREVCGAVSGMFFVLGHLYGYDTPGDDELKKQLYSQVQELAAQFREQCGSIICREILDNPPTDPTPSPRTAEYYAKRPCALMVKTAGDLMDAFIKNHPLEASDE